MKGLIELRNLVKFLEDSSFGSNFRDHKKLALQSFSLVFHGVCTKTLPVMQRKVIYDICGGF